MGDVDALWREYEAKGLGPGSSTSRNMTAIPTESSSSRTPTASASVSRTLWDKKAEMVVDFPHSDAHLATGRSTRSAGLWRRWSGFGESSADDKPMRVEKVNPPTMQSITTQEGGGK